MTHCYPLSFCTSLRLSPASSFPGWTCLPLPSQRTGIASKLRRCTGCLRSFHKNHLPDLPCVFNERGFPYEDGSWAIPCGTVYHHDCLCSGHPFTTRLANDKGLGFPKCDPGLFPNYICESCQVRAHKDRELVQGSMDVVTLMMEQ